MRVCIGGTFNILHEGHKRLFDKALELASDGGSVHIGLAVGQLINDKKNVNSFDFRKKVILEYISGRKLKTKVEILPIYTKFGFAVDNDYDIIVVSPETKVNALEINKNREGQGYKPLEIVEISYVMAEDGKPISSTRILNNEIDCKGYLV
jgi:pantetheine-phosphate adenylyltransferase